MCNPVLGTDLCAEMYCMVIGPIELEIKCLIAFWKAIYFYFHLLKYQSFLMSILGVIKFWTEVAHWDFGFEQQICGIYFKGLKLSNKVLLF